jgi:monofunctional biosynthetic peptidoglycan transglycosylase
MSESRLRDIRRRLRYLRALTVVRVLAVAVSLFLVLPYLITPLYWLADPVSTLMLGRWLTGQRVERTVIPLERMGPYLPLMVVVAEDGRFCDHFGIDVREI